MGNPKVNIDISFETVVLTHTLTDWIPFFLYVTFNAVE